jgi:hypothetical protein
MTDAEKISMTLEELAALVEAQVAKRDDERKREAVRTWELENPIAPPAPPINAPPELMAELTSALDASGNDVDKATNSILWRLNLDPKGRATDPTFRALFYEWSFARDLVHPGLRAALIKNVLTNIRRKREREGAGV